MKRKAPATWSGDASVALSACGRDWAIASFARMEVASYRILVTAAEAAAQAQIARVASELLQQEIEFAEWVDGQVPEVTRRYLTLEYAPVTGAAGLPTG